MLCRRAPPGSAARHRPAGHRAGGLSRLLRVPRLRNAQGLSPGSRLEIIDKGSGRRYQVVVSPTRSRLLAIGSVLFEDVNRTLWGDVAVAMLTLFRIATFEDWTDVMYETMEVYPFSWIFYLSFIFLAAFVFLNMMIGVVLDVMQREHLAMDMELAENEATEPVEDEETVARRLERMERKLDALVDRLDRASPWPKRAPARI